MSPRPKIALLPTADPSLLAQLQAIPGGPSVQFFDDLYRDATAITAFAPRLVFAEHSDSFAETLGALRLLRALLPELSIVLLCDPSTIEDLRRETAGADVLLLERPISTGKLHQVVQDALHGEDDRPAPRYLEFAQGICDEINNPLQLASGHLRLLETQLDPGGDQTLLEQIRAVREGLVRITGTMHKVADMSRAADGMRTDDRFVIGTLLDEVEAALKEQKLDIQIRCSDEARRRSLRGDLALHSHAIVSLCQVGCDLSQDPQSLSLIVGRTEDHVEIRMRVEDSRLERWELPKAFEPYQLNRILRGTRYGLNLFLVRTVAHAHGGDAVARRLSDRSVEFILGLGVVN